MGELKQEIVALGFALITFVLCPARFHATVQNLQFVSNVGATVEINQAFCLHGAPHIP
jgi:hypothetical protein